MTRRSGRHKKKARKRQYKTGDNEKAEMGGKNEIYTDGHKCSNHTGRPLETVTGIRSCVSMNFRVVEDPHHSLKG